MILYPAIDLKDGACVRLKQGEMASATVFNTDPAAQAREFEAAGFRYLHVVDLDGAFAGKPMNAKAVEAIRAATRFPIQLGGGIRDLATVEGWLGKGVTRVILGTAAVRDPAFVREACRLHPGKIVVGIDARGGKVAVEGWGEASELGVVELARRFEDAGVAAIVFTDIGRDGLLKGLNIEATLELARAVSIPVIASGGLAGMADVERLLEPDCRILQGAIAGRALYDGRLDPASAVDRLKGIPQHPQWLGFKLAYRIGFDGELNRVTEEVVLEGAPGLSDVLYIIFVPATGTYVRVGQTGKALRNRVGYDRKYLTGQFKGAERLSYHWGRLAEHFRGQTVEVWTRHPRRMHVSYSQAAGFEVQSRLVEEAALIAYYRPAVEGRGKSD